MIENLVKNYDECIDLKITLCKILEEINNTQEKYKRKSLISWKRKYLRRINEIENPEAIKYMAKNCRPTEEFIENYLYSVGFNFNEYNITKFLRQYEIPIGRLDLLGITDSKEVIIEIKARPAKAAVIGQVLSYWQYFKEHYNKDNDIIVIAPSYTEQYRYALKACFVKITTVEYTPTEEGLSYCLLTS
jgi:hypothetical protein